MGHKGGSVSGYWLSDKDLGTDILCRDKAFNKFQANCMTKLAKFPKMVKMCWLARIALKVHANTQ